MKKCPYCAEAIQDDAPQCPFCTTSLTASVVAPGIPLPFGPGESQTSGKAIASLICGIFFFILPAAIVAVFMGHLSLSDISRSAGRVVGRGMAITGLVFGYAGLSLIPVLIIATIAIPNLLRSKMAANEASAAGSLRVISTACATYMATHPSFPPTLAGLGPRGPVSPSGANLMDQTLASGSKSGYTFAYEAQAGPEGAFSAYTLHADPAGATGLRHFFVKHSGIIRVSNDEPANEDSPPLR